MISKKDIFISILLLLFTIFQVNNNDYYINKSSINKTFEYKDYIKGKTLSENFHNQLLNSELRENISFLKQNNSDNDNNADSLYSTSLFSLTNQITKQEIEFLELYSTVRLSLHYKPRAPPLFSIYS